MSRCADYTIQGFLYQFNKTLVEILTSEDHQSVVIEGIVEDIEIFDDISTKAIQCKYHEAQSAFTLSSIYKPLLQMMSHFINNREQNITYVLYGHFPGMQDSPSLTAWQIKDILATKNKELSSLASKIKDNIDIDAFLSCFKFELGKKLDELSKDVCLLLADNGFPLEEVEFLGYPNAIQLVAQISIKHSQADRITTKQQVVQYLLGLRKTAVTRWTLALKNHKKIMEARKKQLKSNLDKNARLRFFIVSQHVLSFNESIVNFIIEYIEKFHYKAAHTKTPCFILDCDTVLFSGIGLRLHKKGIKFNDGTVCGQFDLNHFLREPVKNIGTRSADIQREFLVRLCSYDSIRDKISELTSDDIFIIGEGLSVELSTPDVNQEHLEIANFEELKYLLGVNHALS